MDTTTIMLAVAALPGAAILGVAWWPRAPIAFRPKRRRWIKGVCPGPGMFTGVATQTEALVDSRLGHACLAFQLDVYAWRGTGSKRRLCIVEKILGGTHFELREAGDAAIAVDFRHGRFDLSFLAAEELALAGTAEGSPHASLFARATEGSTRYMKLVEYRLDPGATLTIDTVAVPSFADPRELMLQGGPEGVARVAPGGPVEATAMARRHHTRGRLTFTVAGLGWIAFFGYLIWLGR